VTLGKFAKHTSCLAWAAKTPPQYYAASVKEPLGPHTPAVPIGDCNEISHTTRQARLMTFAFNKLVYILDEQRRAIAQSSKGPGT